MLTPFVSGRDPFAEMRGLLRRMDEVFRDFDAPLPGFGLSPDNWPTVDLRDEGDEIVLMADVPGMSEKEVAIEATQESVTIRGERMVTPPDGYTAHRQERRSIRFARSFALPGKIDLENVTATVKDGVLTLRASKLPEARPKQIAIKAS